MAITFNFDTLQIHRLLRKNSVDAAIRILRVGLIVLAALLVLLLIQHIVGSFLDTSSSLSKLKENLAALSSKQGDVKKPAKVTRDYSIIASNKIFGELGTQVITQATAAPKPVTQLSLQLIGTFVTEGQSPYAIIEDTKKKTQDVFMVKESIFGEAKLVSIHSDRVEIDRNGTIEILRLDDTPEDTVEMKGGVASVGENQFVVEESELDKALENLPLLLTQARAVPYFKEGRSIGLRMFAIRSASLFEKIGLRNGDVLKSVNGNSLADLSQAMKLFERLKEERSLTLTLERNNEEKELRYQIR